MLNLMQLTTIARKEVRQFSFSWCEIVAVEGRISICIEMVTLSGMWKSLRWCSYKTVQSCLELVLPCATTVAFPKPQACISLRGPGKFLQATISALDLFSACQRTEGKKKVVINNTRKLKLTVEKVQYTNEMRVAFDSGFYSSQCHI